MRSSPDSSRRSSSARTKTAYFFIYFSKWICLVSPQCNVVLWNADADRQNDTVKTGKIKQFSCGWTDFYCMNWSGWREATFLRNTDGFFNLSVAGWTVEIQIAWPVFILNLSLIKNPTVTLRNGVLVLARNHTFDCLTPNIAGWK